MMTLKKGSLFMERLLIMPVATWLTFTLHATACLDKFWRPFLNCYAPA